MIVIMKPNATAAEIGAVIRRAESLGVTTHPIYGDNRTVVALVGDLTRVSRESFNAMDGVNTTVRIQEPYKLASRTTRPENSVIDVGGAVRIGGPEVVVMAGPCSVESRDQIVETTSPSSKPKCCAAAHAKYTYHASFRVGLKGSSTWLKPAPSPACPLSPKS